jgi:hypothetical protein
LHPDATNPDDRIDLTNKVFASVAGTTTVSFSGQNAAPGNHDFYLLNSPSDASKQLLVIGLNGGTANVSTQGFGVDNQSINPNETLQVDFVTGGNLAAGSASQIQYGGHIETITQAGFTINQITPSQPTKRVDLSISAFNNTGNEQGSDFFDGTATSPVDITSIKLTGASGFASTITADGTYATSSGNVTVSGLTGTGNTVTITGLDNVTTVDITTSSPMDRLAVKGVDANEGCDITEFHYSSTSTNASTKEVGSFINFDDDGPSIDPSAAAVPTLTVDETTFATDASASFASLFTSGAFGNDGFKDADNNNVQDADALSYKLGISATNVASGLIDTLTNESVTLSVNLAGTVVTGSSATGGTVFTITLNAATGNVTLDQVRTVVQDDPTDPDESTSPAQLSAANLVTLTATITDGDLDTDTATRNIGDAFKFEDDGPTITVPSSAGTAATAAQLGNAAGQSVIGSIGWDVGNDGSGSSDFVATPTLTGSVELTGAILNPTVTAGAEDSHSATFNFSLNFDTDPNVAGVQNGTAAGTLTFNKDTDQFTINMTDPVEGFSFSVLHTSELLAKAPAGNTGHPELVVTELDTDTPGGSPDGFYVQFTANSLNQANPVFGFNATGDGPLPNPNDTTYNNGQFITNNFEDWVSATQSTNGVAGDTIQKGELLTLRFFGENILGDVTPGAPGGGTEKVTPTTTAGGVAIKFDGVGNSEDLVVILDLKDSVTGSTTTRAINVQNSDLIKGAVPAPYNQEFTLDNNDALLIMEANDYNATGEHYEIRGIQIMQSANGLTGQGINLNGAVGSGGGSNATGGLQAWDATDNDVLKIVDIGFIQTTSVVQDAALDFSFQINDGDFDTTATQHIHVAVSNDFIV